MTWGQIWQNSLNYLDLWHFSPQMGFVHFQSQNCHTKRKIRVLGKRPKFICWAAPILIFVLFGGAPGFSPKTGFPKSTDFGWNHWKHSAKVARPQNAIFAPKGPKEAILVMATKWSRNMFHYIALPFPFTFKKTSKIVWDFLRFSLLDNRSLSITLAIEVFLCNKYLSCLSWFCCVLVGCVCFCFCVGTPASDSPSSCPFISSSLFYLFFPLVFSSYLGCMSSCFCVYYFPAVVFFLLLCFLLFITYVIFILSSLLLCFFACISFDCSCCCGFVLIPPLSHLVFLLLPRPPRALEKENNGRKLISFCLPFGDPGENVLSQIACVVFFMGSGLFLFSSRRHFGIVYPWLLCPDAASSTSCLVREVPGLNRKRPEKNKKNSKIIDSFWLAKFFLGIHSGSLLFSIYSIMSSLMLGNGILSTINRC